jgi:ribose transport system substrate-binding protein
MKGLKLGVLLLAGVLLAPALVMAGAQKEGAAAEPTTLCTAVKFLESPYHAAWIKGGEMFAESEGLEAYHVSQACQGSSEKQLNDIKGLVAKTGANVVFNIDPNEAPDVVPIAKALEDAGVYFVTWWNKPEDVKVWDYPHWVSHITFDGTEGGYHGATQLFKSFKTPYKGKIVALQGQLANSAQIERWAGLNKALAEYPEVKMVAYQSAEWNRAKAFEMLTSMLVAHPDVDGVWCANDEMAMGAIEALRAQGLAGKVKVCGADGQEDMVRAIVAGEAVATFYPDPTWQGGIGLSLALAAKRGELDVAALTKEKRQWYAKTVLVSPDNAKKFLQDYYEGTPDYDWSDHFGRFLRAIP